MPRKFSGDTIILATNNKGKIAELSDLLSPHARVVKTSAELNIPEPRETGTTFHENAAIKAIETARAAKCPALADDSGLCIHALGGEPGVYTADWAGHPRNFRMAMQRALSALRDQDDRSAYFQSVIALAWPDGHVEYAEGRIDGTITRAPRGVGGFGYDPIFMPLGHSKTFGEMCLKEKKSMSHRSMALKNIIDLCF